MRLIRSAPFIVLTLGLAAGIWLASQFALPLWLMGGVLAALALVAAFLPRTVSANTSPETLWLAITATLIALGAARYTIATEASTNVWASRFTGQQVILDGVVVAEPDVRDTHTNLRVRPDTIAGRSAIHQPDANTDPGVVLIRAEPNPAQQWHYGDRIRADGQLSAPPRMSAFDYRDYLARRGVQTWMPRPDQLWQLEGSQGDWLYSRILEAKDAMRRAVVRMMPAPESALLNGILIGDDNAIPDDVNEAFRRTGTSHIVAISGFNVSIVIGVVTWLLTRLVNPRPAAAVALPAIVLYTVFVGGSPSVVRASVMAGIGLIGLLFFRRGFSLNTLSASAFVMLLAEPNLLFDLGFQLSIMATLGLMLYADKLSAPLNAWLEARIPRPRLRKVASFLLDGALMTTAAQITTLPIIIVAYDQLSVVTLLTNFLVLPVQSLLMVIGLVAALVCTVVPLVTPVVGWVPYPLLWWTIAVVRWMGGWPFAVVRVGGFGTPAAIAYYAALVGLTWAGAVAPATRTLAQTVLRRNLRAAGLLGVMGLGLAAGLVYWLQRPDGKLHIAARGGSLLIQTPSGQHVLFTNGGRVLPMLDTALPAWDRDIEWLLVPAADERTRADAQVTLDHFRATTLLTPASSNRNALAPLQAETTITVPLGGKAFAVEPSIELQARPNAKFLMNMRLTYGETKILVLAACPSPWPDKADLILADPRTCNLEQLLTNSPHWLVWADNGESPIGLQNKDIRQMSLSNVEQVTFVGDGTHLIVQ